ncbi:MAG: WG repeat-containing protein [Bacteroidales bacterium]|nr:WG repeat-containing protein [Bacteroidales bacterium]
MLKKLSILILIFYPVILMAQDIRVVRNSQGKYGFVDKFGDTIIDCSYDYAEDFYGGLALVKNNLRYKIVDTAGNLHDLADYDGSAVYRHDMGEFHSGLPVIVKEWDCSYISSSGDVYLEIPYQDAFSFNAGKAKVIDGDKYNYISKNGLLLDDWTLIEDNYHAIKNGDKFGYIDRNGKLVIDYEFLKATDFQNGYAQINNGTYWAVIDKQGRKISDWYEVIHPFESDLAIVEKIGNIGFINKNGRFMGQWYNSIVPLDYGLFKVEKYDQFAIVNNEGFLVTQWFQEIYDYKNGYVKVKKDDKFAYLNKIGAIVIGWYDKIDEVNNGIVRISNNNKHAFYNVEKFITSEFYDYIGNFYDGLAVVKQGDKFGYIDKNCVLVFPIEYSNVSDFNGGIAQIEKDNKAAYVNTSGEVVLGWYESKTYIFNEPPRGLVALRFGAKYGFQTINGRRVIPAKFDYAENFSDGLALIKNNPRDMYINRAGELKPLSAYPNDTTLRLDVGYQHTNQPIKIKVWDCAFIDYNGDIVFNLQNITDAFSFKSGKAMVVNGEKYNYIDLSGKIIGNWTDFPDDFNADFKNGKFGFINKNGDLVIDYKFNRAKDFSGGLAQVRVGSRTDGKYGYINRSGEFVTKMYDEISDFDNGIAIVKLNSKYSVIDTSGYEIAQWYDKIESFSEGFALVKNADKYTFINSKGGQFNEWFTDADDFNGGMAKVKIYDKWGFINRRGELIVRTVYDNVWNYQNNIAKVEKDGLFAFIDLNGRLITDWYERIFFFSDERAVVVKDKKWGYIDISGKVVINIMYDRAFAFSNGEALVVQNGVMVKIDKDGQIIPD